MVNPNNSCKTLWAIGIQIIVVISFSMMQLLAKLMFHRHPDLNQIQYLFMRASIQSVIHIAIMNVRIKKFMIDKIRKERIPFLVFKVIQGLISHIVVFNAIRYLPMVEVALIINTMPLFTAVFGYCFLNESLSPTEIASLAISFIGIIVLVTGKHQASEEAPSE